MNLNVKVLSISNTFILTYIKRNNSNFVPCYQFHVRYRGFGKTFKIFNLFGKEFKSFGFSYIDTKIHVSTKTNYLFLCLLLADSCKAMGRCTNTGVNNQVTDSLSPTLTKKIPHTGDKASFNRCG